MADQAPTNPKFRGMNAWQKVAAATRAARDVLPLLQPGILADKDAPKFYVERAIQLAEQAVTQEAGNTQEMHVVAGGVYHHAVLGGATIAPAEAARHALLAALFVVLGNATEAEAQAAEAIWFAAQAKAANPFVSPQQGE